VVDKEWFVSSYCVIDSQCFIGLLRSAKVHKVQMLTLVADRQTDHGTLTSIARGEIAC